MRDRLIELINDVVHPCHAGALADYLLENGVIVPPCKVGTEVYFAVQDREWVLKGELLSYSLDAAHLWMFCRYRGSINYWHVIEDFGKTVFLTCEEAERALKGEK
jgi:hypothetical protein